jgi:hypothetical protein
LLESENFCWNSANLAMVAESHWIPFYAVGDFFV